MNIVGPISANQVAPQQAQQGFTLLEILVAMAIFTLIGLASTSVLTSVIGSDELSTQRFEKLEVLQRAMLTLERDILQAVPRAIRINGESSNMVISGGEDLFGSEADGIALVRGGWHNPQFMLRRSTLQAVGYRLQEGQLQRLYGNYLDNVIGFEPKVRVLLEDVEDFQIEFLSQTSSDTDEESVWQEDYSANVLPVAVAVTISTSTFGVIRREFMLSGAG
ncbi:MAG: general secretion pathway protein J [Paraglaciecola sp.]|jgi:general secretion pathway protein J